VCVCACTNPVYPSGPNELCITFCTVNSAKITRLVLSEGVSVNIRGALNHLSEIESTCCGTKMGSGRRAGAWGGRECIVTARSVATAVYNVQL